MKKKKVFVTALLISMIMTMVGCGKAPAEETSTTPEPEYEAVVEPETTEPEESETSESSIDESEPLEEDANVVNDEMQERLHKVVELYTEFTLSEDDNMWFFVDNIEHCDVWYNKDTYVPPVFKDGSSTFENMNTATMEMAAAFDNYVNKGVSLEEAMDLNGWASQFENEQALLDEWNGGGDDDMVDNYDQLMLGTIRFAATLCQRGYSLGEVSLDDGYQWREYTSKYIVPILMDDPDDEDDTFVDMGFRGVFDEYGNLMNIVYMGEGSAEEAMVYTYGEGDFNSRGGTMDNQVNAREDGAPVN